MSNFPALLWLEFCTHCYGLDWKESIILTWSGLRGAVSLSLALSVKQSSGNSYLSSETGARFLFFTGGIVFLTLVVNGSTTQLLLHLFRMDALTATKKRIWEYTKCGMMKTALKAFENLGDDEELGSADWRTVKTHISSLKDLDGRQVNLHNGYEASNVDPTNIMDIRIRFLNGVQAAYWEMLDDGRITQSTANVLMQSVGNSDIASTVTNESEVEGEEAKQFLKDVRDSFPQVLSVLKTRQVTHYVLNHLKWLYQEP